MEAMLFFTAFVFAPCSLTFLLYTLEHRNRYDQRVRRDSLLREILYHWFGPDSEGWLVAVFASCFSWAILFITLLAAIAYPLEPFVRGLITKWQIFARIIPEPVREVEAKDPDGFRDPA